MTVQTFLSNLLKAILLLLFLKFLFLKTPMIVNHFPEKSIQSILFILFELLSYIAVYYISLAFISKKLKKELLNVTRWQIVFGVSMFIIASLFLFNPQTYLDFYSLYTTNHGHNTEHSRFKMLIFIIGLIFFYISLFAISLILLSKKNKNALPENSLINKIQLFSAYVIISIFIINQIIYLIRNMYFETIAVDNHVINLLNSTTQTYIYGDFYHYMEAIFSLNTIAITAVISLFITIILTLGILRYIILSMFRNLDFKEVSINYFIFLFLLSGSMNSINTFIIQLNIDTSVSAFTLFTSFLIFILIIYSKKIQQKSNNTLERNSLP